MYTDMVTYLHHHGPQDAGEKIPWLPRQGASRSVSRLGLMHGIERVCEEGSVLAWRCDTLALKCPGGQGAAGRGSTCLRHMPADLLQYDT